MPEADLFLPFVRPLNRAGIRYMIGGSVAVIFCRKNFRKTPDLRARKKNNQVNLRDIRSMLRISGEQIEAASLKEWITRLGLEREWEEAQRDPAEPLSGRPIR